MAQSGKVSPAPFSHRRLMASIPLLVQKGMQIPTERWSTKLKHCAARPSAGVWSTHAYPQIILCLCIHIPIVALVNVLAVSRDHHSESALT
uniref:Uncharacterized protein n=1 Tax=Peronospora matthiolae TaxID=2874970 RepID=A0AAV1V596_9STRA